jgi:hypothetical protein
MDEQKEPKGQPKSQKVLYLAILVIFAVLILIAFFRMQ